MQAYIQDFVKKTYHLTWIKKVGKKFYSSKGLALHDYIYNLCDQTIPLDELGLMICARMYHHYIAIVLHNEIWCTRKDNNYEKC